ncbi:hypothetical protein NMG60_11001330 [Bertholletia excelsa]
MGRAPCCDKANVKKGPWSPEEDAKLKEYIEKNGTGGNWIALPQKAGLKRCGKSCRLRWLNYLRPNIKHGEFSDEEDRIICGLFANIGSRWSIIAAQLPGRTDNDIKNYWNTKLKKKLMNMVPNNSQTRPYQHPNYPSMPLIHTSSSSSSPYSPPSSSLSSNTFYVTQTSPLMGFDQPISIPSSLLKPTCSSNANSSTIVQAQEGFLSPMYNNYQVREGVLVFGGEASCSSSDGSYGREQNTDHDYGSSNGHDHVGFQSFLYNGVDDQSHRFMLSSGGEAYHHGMYGGENPVDYTSLEEIKQLISTNGCNNNMGFFVDEIKTEEKVFY